GHYFSLGEFPNVRLYEWHEKYGPLLHLNMGAQHWIMISDPYIAHELLVKNGAKASNRSEHSFSYMNYSKAGRNVNQYADIFELTADTAVDQMREATEIKGSVNPSMYLKLATYSTLFNIILGKHMASIDDPVFKDILWITQTIIQKSSPQKDIHSIFPWMSWVENINGTKQEKASIVSFRDRLYESLLKEALCHDTDCIAKQVYSTKDEQNLSDLILAGDTVSSYLLWFFAILAQYSCVQKKMCAEIDALVTKTGRIPCFSDRDELPYVCCVLKEIGRFRSPSNFGVPHVVSRDIEASGYFIPKDTLLMISMHAMHKNKDLYSDPLKFKPERFEESKKMWSTTTNGPIDERDTYIFGWGRRTCPAIYFTEAQIFDICVRTLVHCSIDPELDTKGNKVVADLDAYNDLGLGSTPEPFKVRLIPRSKYILDNSNLDT
ncbi:cytochrome P450, partial [Phycomyces nitens]